jgi:nucleotide-binding universal stress UspA family protein
MIRHQRVLVALSGTAADRPLVSYARMLAEIGFARHYHFVHVLTPARMIAASQSEAHARTHCENLLHEVFASAELQVTSSCHVLTGVRVDALIEFITLQRCDTALLGHWQNRSGQRSLARRLAMVAPCSVWLVPEGAPVSITGIMVPIDFSDHSADALTVAAAIARAAGLSECFATHVFSDPSMVRYDEQVDEFRRSEQNAFETFLAGVDRHGLNVHPLFVEGNNVARTLLHTAKAQRSDLLVMNTRGRSRAASILLGSVTSQVMVEAPIAVLVLKHFGAMMNLFQALQQSHLWTRPNPKTN